MKITAVIPIRKGSQRVKDKNLRPFAGSTLMEIKINSLLQVEIIDEIIVNTNSEEAIAIVGNKYKGTKVKVHRREEYYASSQCSGSAFFRHLGEVTDTDIFVYTPCTSPFIAPETKTACIKKYIQQTEYDCVATVSNVKEFLWKDGIPVNYDPTHAPNSQDLPDIVALNFGATVVGRNTLIKNSNIIGKKPCFIVTDEIEQIDIDTPLDFYLAEQMYIKLKVEKKELLD